MPVQMEMLIDSGTAAARTVTGERGEFMTFPGAVEQAPFSWSIDAPDTIGVGSHDVIIRVYDAVGLVSSTRAHFVSAMPARSYGMLVLTGLGGADGSASALNRLGDVAGWSFDPAGRRHAMIWRNGTPEMLAAADTLDTWANAINDRGDVAGAAMTTTALCTRPALWQSGTMRIIGDGPLSTCMLGQAIAINSGGTTLVSAGGYGYLVQEGVVTTLPFEYPYALNDRGQVVGQSAGSEAAYAAGWNISFTPPTYLPFGAGHVFTAATGINDREEVIGNSRGRPFIVRAGEPSVDLMPFLG